MTRFEHVYVRSAHAHRIYLISERKRVLLVDPLSRFSDLHAPSDFFCSRGQLEGIHSRGQKRQRALCWNAWTHYSTESNSALDSASMKDTGTTTRDVHSHAFA